MSETRMDHDGTPRAFRGAVAIVTGGASGIGRALAEELAGRGAEVVLADRQVDLAGQVAAGIRDRGGRAVAEELDVTRFDDVDRLVRRVAEDRGRIDYMFNNAGIGIGGEASDYQAEDWDQIIDVNLRSVAYGVRAVYPIMIRQGFGHIVNTASMAGLMPSPMMVGYSATKHAVVGLSLSLRLEAEAYGVRVGVLCPGVIRTAILHNGGVFGKMLRPIAPESQRAYWERLRPMEPDRFARRALDAVSRNQAIIIEPRRWAILWWLHRLSPSIGLALGRRHLRAIRLGAERHRQRLASTGSTEPAPAPAVIEEGDESRPDAAIM